ncbi:hypothetical protein D3C80_1777450 [compost metagenome]
MNRQANGAGLVHDGPFDGLTNPPGRVGRKAETALWIKLFHRPDQPQVALFDQVEQRQPTIDITPGDFHHQSQVAFNHALAPGRIATLRQARKMHFFFRGQQGGKADFIEVQLRRVERPRVVNVLVLFK